MDKLKRALGGQDEDEDAGIIAQVCKSQMCEKTLSLLRGGTPGTPPPPSQKIQVMKLKLSSFEFDDSVVWLWVIMVMFIFDS